MIIGNLKKPGEELRAVLLRENVGRGVGRIDPIGASTLRLSGRIVVAD